MTGVAAARMAVATSLQGEGVVEEASQFGQVLAHLSGGRRSRSLAAGVAHRVLATQLAHDAVDVRRREAPGALVLRFFLTPDDLGIGKPRQFVGQSKTGERIDLLDAQDLNAVFAALLAF